MSPRAFASFVVVALGGCPGGQVKPDDVQPPAAAPSFAGGWESACLPVQNADGTDGFAKLSFDLTATTWSLDSGSFADEACASALGTFHSSGSWSVEKPSATIPGAFDARFDVAARTVTPHVDGYIAFLQSMSCGKPPYKVGEAQDVLDAGCSMLGYAPKASCPSNFDVLLLAADGKSLQFGARPSDSNLCTPDKRPTTLGPPLQRVR